MRIGFFTETYLPHLNGVAVSLAFVKSELEKNGHEVFIFAPKIKNHKDTENNIIRLRSLTIINAEAEQKLPISAADFRKILKLKLDIVHGHGGGFVSILGYELALTKGYPYIFTYHTYLEKYTHYFFLKNKKITNKIAKNSSRFICNISDLVIVPSQKMKTILQNYQIKKEITVVPNPIDLTSFTKLKSDFLRQKLQLPKDKLVLLTVSRLGQEKNIDFLIKSFAQVCQKNNQAILVIVGAGPEQEKLEKLSEKLGLQNKIFFTGYIDAQQMPAVYSAADIFVFASTTETQGLVILEAAACQLPIIAVKDEAFYDVVKNDFNGYLVAEDTSLFADKILYLLKDKDKRKQFGLNSSQYVREVLNQSKIIKRFEQIYSEAIESRKNKPRTTLRVQNNIKKFLKFFS